MRLIERLEVVLENSKTRRVHRHMMSYAFNPVFQRTALRNVLAVLLSGVDIGLSEHVHGPHFA